MTDENKLAALLLQMNAARKRAAAVLESFTCDLARDPVHAFEWGGSALEAAAQAWVIDHLRKTKMHDPPQPSDVAVVLEEARRQTLSYARRGTRSTSEMSNLMTAEIMSAWAAIIGMVAE